jgi:hypothetical protein
VPDTPSAQEFFFSSSRAGGATRLALVHDECGERLAEVAEGETLDVILPRLLSATQGHQCPPEEPPEAENGRVLTFPVNRRRPRWKR